MNLMTNTKGEYDSLPLPTLARRRELASEELTRAKKIVEEIDAAIERRVADAVEAARHDAEKFEGTIHVAIEGCDVKHEIPKRTEWDQGLLSQACQHLVTAGRDPMDFVTWKGSVTESALKAFPKDVSGILRAAQVIKHGTAKISVTPTE